MLKTIELLKTEGWNALVDKLGLVEATRYLLQFQRGAGDYTEIRRDLFKDISVREILTEIKTR
jgi:hypothetical protein